MTTKEEKFRRLLEKRLKKLMKQFDLIANLSNGRYSCSKKEANELVNQIDTKFKYIQELFERRLSLNAKKK